MLSIPSGSPYVDSIPELDDINEAYQATAYAYDWPSLLPRVGIAKVANLDRYSLPANFRKARTVKLDGVVLTKTEREFLKHTRRGFFIDQVQNDIVLKPVPSAASDVFTLDNAESAGNAVTIELDTVSGLAQHDEIWIDSASGTDEFSLVSSVDTSGITITARLDAAKSAGDVIYRAEDIIDIEYYRLITLLSTASDVTLLPAAIDYIMLFKAASLAYTRLEQYAEADKNEERWRNELQVAWLALDKQQTGEVAEFTL